MLQAPPPPQPQPPSSFHHLISSHHFPSPFFLFSITHFFTFPTLIFIHFLSQLFFPYKIETQIQSYYYSQLNLPRYLSHHQFLFLSLSNYLSLYLSHWYNNPLVKNMVLRKGNIALAIALVVLGIQAGLSQKITRASFPKGFVFGTSSSSYQVGFFFSLFLPPLA